MPVPDYADPRPAYQQIADDLRAQIASGELPPGERLKSNRALSEQYGVAAETIRQALDVLRQEGLIASQSTRGTYVLRPNPPDDPDSPESTLATLAARLQSIEDRLDDTTSQLQLLAEMEHEVQEHARLLARIRSRMETAGIPLADSEPRDEQAM
jgi:DNA-binding GntR family transcriptional regulator